MSLFGNMQNKPFGQTQSAFGKFLFHELLHFLWRPLDLPAAIFLIGGFNATPTSTPFGQSTFAKPATTGFSAPAFGQSTGTSLFGQTTQPATGGLFGQAAQGSAFGQAPTQSAFGNYSEEPFVLVSPADSAVLADYLITQYCRLWGLR